MISLSDTRISRALPRGHRAPALFRLLAALAVAAAGLVPVEGGAAEAGATVARHVPHDPGSAVRPLAVIDREDIALSGMRTVSELLSSQRRFTRYGLLSRQRLSRFGVHRTLLLEDRVSYLVNGRRIADSTVNLSTLPAAAVERIEVLQGGAAALHGGHAVAGAINIVLQRGDDGLEVTAVADRPTRPGGDVEQAGIRWGGALGRGHLTVIADVLRREEIPEAVRAYSAARWTPGGRFADAAGISVGGNTVFVATRSYDDNGAVASVHVPGVAGPSIARPLGGCPKDRYAGVLTEPLGTPGSGCGFSYADRAWGMQREGRQRVFLALDHPLGRRTDAYLDIRIAGGETRERYAPAVGTFSVSSEALREVLLPDPDIDSLPRTVRVSHRFLGHGDREWRTSLEEHDVTVGLEGKSAGVGYDAHLRYYRRDAGGVGNTFVSRSAIQKFIDAGRYDLVNPWSPGNRDAYRETALRQSRDRVTNHRTLRVSMNGPMFALSGGAAR
ncbi:MAG: TonB-dependent receptor plug domain-containing protein, partial [Rhodospirillales bacterium]|nr:TonB-dependent receptor plug domain-containing protein [Rhodospirillales bacterium]